MGLQWRQRGLAGASQPARLFFDAEAATHTRQLLHMDTHLLNGLRPEWFAVQVWAGREALSARHLRQRGYEVFLPCYREPHRWSDRVKQIEKALFAGYVFCRATAAVVGKVTTSVGVMRVVGDGRGPIAIPDDEIGMIHRIVDTRLSVEPCTFLTQGQRVRIEDGPLRGVHGLVLQVKGGHRLVVSISMLHRSVAVEIDQEWITIPYDAWRDEVMKGAGH